MENRWHYPIMNVIEKDSKNFITMRNGWKCVKKFDAAICECYNKNMNISCVGMIR